MFEKNLLVDVFEAYYFQKVNGKNKLVFMSRNLTNAGINNSQDEIEVRNGAGNGLFAVLGGQKTVEVNLTENVFDFHTVALQTGSEIVTGAGIGLTSPVYNVVIDGTSKTYTLEHSPIESAEIEIYAQGSETPLANSTYTIDGSVITFSTVPPTPVDIMPYKYATEATSKTIVVEADKFAEGGELWLKTVKKDTKEKATHYVYIIMENVKPNGQFEINTTSEKQPVEMTVNMKVMKDNNGQLYRIHEAPIGQ